MWSEYMLTSMNPTRDPQMVCLVLDGPPGASHGDEPLVIADPDGTSMGAAARASQRYIPHEVHPAGEASSMQRTRPPTISARLVYRPRLHTNAEPPLRSVKSVAYRSSRRSCRQAWSVRRRPRTRVVLAGIRSENLAPSSRFGFLEFEDDPGMISGAATPRKERFGQREENAQ